MHHRSPVRDGTSLPAVGAGNIDFLGTRHIGGRRVRWSVCSKGFMGRGNGCIEPWWGQCGRALLRFGPHPKEFARALAEAGRWPK